MPQSIDTGPTSASGLSPATGNAAAAERLFAANLKTGLANRTQAQPGDTLSAVSDGASERQAAVRRQLIDAFAAHARADTALAGNADPADAIAAYIAARTGPGATDRWLENDTPLMLRLARAMNLFDGEPDAASLAPGHRRLLANSLALALTQSINWPAALGADPADGAALFYDGITLRNASHLSIKDAAAAIDTRIGKALDADPATKGMAALIPQLRGILIGDPTLSLATLPADASYGSRQWASLWSGLDTCVTAGIDPATLSPSEVAAFGQAMGPMETEPILLMAHAAGKVDLAQLREDNQQEFTKKIQDFAAEEFKPEIELANATAQLVTEVPTARSIAEETLKDKGLDPMEIVVEEPISSKGKRSSYKLHDFYVKFDKLSEIEPGSLNSSLIDKIKATDADQANGKKADGKSKGIPPYKEVFDRKFDAYISGHIDAHQTVVRLVAGAARKDGFKESDSSASIRIDRVGIASHPDIRAQGFHITCIDSQNVHRYFYSLGGSIERIPDAVSRDDWFRLHSDTALAQEDLEKIRSTSGSDIAFSCTLEKEISAHPSRIRDSVEAYLRPKLLELKKQSEPVQDGVSKADRVLESFVPFYGVGPNIKRGNYVTAYVSFITSVMTVLPAAVAAGKLIAVSKKALMPAIQATVSTLARRVGVRLTFGWVKKYGSGGVATFAMRQADAMAPLVGQHALHTSGALFDAFVPGPLAALRQSVAGSISRYFNPATLRKAAAGLRGKFPRLAAQLRMRADTLVGKTATRIRNVLPNPKAPNAVFSKGLTADGATRWLRRLGNGYTSIDPYRLHGAGPVLLQGDNGRLFPSLPVSELTRHAVTDATMLDKLWKAAPAHDGTLAVDGKTFARIAGIHVPIVPHTPARNGAPPAWQTPPTAAGAAGADIATALTYDANKGGWISLADSHDDAVGLASVLDQWTANRQYLAEPAGTLTKASAIARIRAHALQIYGERYADHLKTRESALLDDLTATDNPVDTAAVLLGDGRFLHAMVRRSDTAPAGRIIDVLDMLRPRALAAGGGFDTMNPLKDRMADYFDAILQDLSVDELQQLRDVLDAHGERTIALLQHAHTGNIAQQRRADEIATMADTLRQAIGTRLKSAGKGAADSAIAPIAAATAPPPTPDELRILESLGLTPVDKGAALSGLGEAGISAYRVAQPRDTMPLSGDLPVFRETAGSRSFITQVGDWFRVQWDGDSDTWRIVQPGKPTAPGIPVRYGSTGWEVHNDVALPSGMPIVRRRINWDAAETADVDIPADINSGRGTYYDRSGTAYVPQGKISQTETVMRASRILELSTDMTPRVTWNDDFSEYFNVLVDNGKTSVLVVPNPHLRDAAGEAGNNQKILEDTKTFFVQLTKSETFRGLLNRAIGEGRLGKTVNNRWTIRVIRPSTPPGPDPVGGARFTVDRQQSTISIPYPRDPSSTTPFYLTKDGQVGFVSARRTIARNLVTMLTKEVTPTVTPWLQNGQLSPQTFKTLGLGERGALDYLAERIMREAGVPMSSFLSHLPFDGSHTTSPPSQGGNAVSKIFHWNDKTKQAIDDAGGYSALQRYVMWQDRYLESVFPYSQAGAAGASKAPNPVSQGNMPPPQPQTQPHVVQPVVNQQPTTSRSAITAVQPSAPPGVFNRLGGTSNTPTLHISRALLDATDDFSVKSVGDDFDQLFDVTVSNADTSVFAQAPGHTPTHEWRQSLKDVTTRSLREIFQSLYRDSETFRGLANLAASQNGQLAGGKWRLEIMLPNRAVGPLAAYPQAFKVDRSQRIALMPHLSTEHIHGEYYLSKSAQVHALQTRRVIVENFIRILGRRNTPRLHEQLNIKDPNGLATIKPQILGERGAIIAVGERIIGEMGVKHPEWKLPPRLSPYPFSENQVTLAAGANGAGQDPTRGSLNDATLQIMQSRVGLDQLENYYDMQTTLLNTRYSQRGKTVQTPPTGAPAANRKRPADPSTVALPPPPPNPQGGVSFTI